MEDKKTSLMGEIEHEDTTLEEDVSPNTSKWQNHD